MDSFAALADPTRRRIVESLAKRSMSSGEIAGLFKITAPAVSQHLKILLSAQLVTVTALGQKRIYELDLSGVDEASAWLMAIRRHWAPRLDALEAQLKQKETKS
jgi:DNA-binding transcriptional ArsR family regulator